MTAEILRATVLHTPRNPFVDERALEAHADGALAVADGAILQTGDYTAVRAAYPDAPVRDLRGSVILPGFIDTHVHYPQTRIIGGLGWSLLDWLDQHALPEEAALADAAYARSVAQDFVRQLIRHGTTTALVFGAHFPAAMDALFETAAAAGLRIISGLVVSDRLLPDVLLQDPRQAYRESKALIERHHQRNGLRYAVTPRFALSASEAMLEVCGALLREHPDVLFQSHLNENRREEAGVRAAFPWSANYLAVYERFGLVGPASVFAHNVHPTGAELQALARTRATVAHCPASNAALGSGIFPMRRHLAANARFALGTDVGAGTGFGMLKEALQCYLMQRIAPESLTLSPAQLLYLATRAGAEALGLENETGDFTAGKSADYAVMQAPPARCCETSEKLLAALITTGGPESIHEVYVRGRMTKGAL